MSGTKEVKYFVFKAYIPLRLQSKVVVLILRKKLNIRRKKSLLLDLTVVFLLCFLLFWFVCLFVFETWTSFTYTDRFLAFACGTLQKQSK